MEGAARQGVDGGLGGGERGVEDVAGQAVEAIEGVFIEHFGQALGAGIVAGAEGVDVALEFDRGAGADADEVEEGLVRLSGLEAFHDGDIEAFLEDRTALGAHAQAANIDDMCGIGEEADDFSVMEGGGDDGEVVQMPGAEPGVVGDVMVTLAHGLGGEFRQEVAHRFHHGVDVAGGAGHRLGQHAALQVEDAGGEIARLAHRGGEGGADHHLRLFLHHRDEAVPLDLALDFFEGVAVGHAN